MIFIKNMEEKNTTNKEKPISTLPEIYQNILGSLLVAYSSSHEAMRFNVARDLAGFVNALIIFSKVKDTKAKYSDKTYGELIEKATSQIDNALLIYRDGGDAGAALVLLGEATDTLKRIIITREMIKEGFEVYSNPLGTQTLERDTQSKNYRRV